MNTNHCNRINQNPGEILKRLEGIGAKLAISTFDKLAQRAGDGSTTNEVLKALLASRYAKPTKEVTAQAVLKVGRCGADLNPVIAELDVGVVCEAVCPGCGNTFKAYRTPAEAEAE